MHPERMHHERGSIYFDMVVGDGKYGYVGIGYIDENGTPVYIEFNPYINRPSQKVTFHPIRHYEHFMDLPIAVATSILMAIDDSMYEYCYRDINALKTRIYNYCHDLREAGRKILDLAFKYGGEIAVSMIIEAVRPISLEALSMFKTKMPILVSKLKKFIEKLDHALMNTGFYASTSKEVGIEQEYE